MPRLDPRSQRTRCRILDTAAAVFSDAGFRHATIRDISRRAGVNLAAVNYHFGDKASLYLEVLRRLEAEAERHHPVTPPDAARLAPEQRLAQFVRSFLFRVLGKEAERPGGTLLAREMADPTEALDVVTREHLQPIADELRTIVSGLLGPGADEATIRRCGVSVISQCLFYHQCRAVLQRLFPDMSFGPDDIEGLAGHVTRFSLAGLRESAATPRRRPRTHRKRRGPRRDPARPA